MANKRKHLSYEERFCIEKMLVINSSFLLISVALSRGLSTVSEEVAKNGGRQWYRAKIAENHSNKSQFQKKKNYNKIVLNKSLAKFVLRALRRGLSADRISLMLRRRQPKLPYASSKSIRRYIRQRSATQ